MWNVSWHFAGSIFEISNWGIFTSLDMSTGPSDFQRRISSLVVFETAKKDKIQKHKSCHKDYVGNNSHWDQESRWNNVTWNNSQEAISIVQICSSRGNLDNSIIHENFNFSLEKKKHANYIVLKHLSVVCSRNETQEFVCSLSPFKGQKK